jgi:hypothetical protein
MVLSCIYYSHFPQRKEDECDEKKPLVLSCIYYSHFPQRKEDEWDEKMNVMKGIRGRVE